MNRDALYQSWSRWESTDLSHLSITPNRITKLHAVDVVYTIPVLVSMEASSRRVVVP